MPCNEWTSSLRSDRSAWGDAEIVELEERHVPFTLEAMANDLGWRKGGGAATELARALDTLRLATFRARVYNARLGETRIEGRCVRRTCADGNILRAGFREIEVRASGGSPGPRSVSR